MEETTIKAELTVQDYFERGLKLRQSNNLERAVFLFQKAINRDPSFAKAYHHLGETFVAQQKLGHAIQAYRKAIEIEPTLEWSYHCLGNALFWQNKLDPAIKNYQKAIEINPKIAVFHEKLGIAFQSKKNFSEAIAQYHKAIEMGGKSDRLYYNLAQALVKQKRWDEAISWYQKAIEVNSKLDRAHHHLGDAFAKLGKLDEAIASYTQAIEVNPKAALSYQNMGDALLRQAKTDEAIAAYQEALKIDSKLAWVHYNLGEIFRKQNRLDEAIASYTRSIESDPFLPSPFIQLMFTKAQPHQLDGVVSCYQKFLEKEPNNPWAYVRLGDTLSKQNNIERAVESYQKASVLMCSAMRPEYARKYWERGTVTSPDFIIIGPMKTGTSALYDYILKHPKVLPCIKKEVHFFNNDGKFEYGVDWYLSHFCPTVEGQSFITGEASPGYMVNNVHDRVFQLFPKMKSIAILRNPVDRAFSHYQHNLKYGFERRSFAEAIASELDVLQGVKDPSEAAKTWNWWERPGYILMGLYTYFIEKWVDLFPKDQFLVLQNEKMLENTQQTMETVFEFLGISEFHREEYPVRYAGSYSPIEQSVREQLSEYFHPHNQRLEECLGYKLDWNE